jgi:predicted permease
VTLIPGGKIFPVRKEDIGVFIGLPLALMGLMLWIACANVATLILAKALERRKEIATRLSLGASRFRLVRQLLTESMLLAVVGGTLGIIWSYWQIGSIDRFKPILPAYMDLQAFISWKALLLTMGASVLTGIFAGLTPALEATRTDLTTALKGSADFPRMKWWGSRNVLVMQQVAASLMLLLITGLVVIGFQRNSGLHVGFDPAHLYRFSLDPIRDGYSNEKTIELISRLQEHLSRLPGVKEVSLATSSPLDLGQNAMNLKTRTDAADRHAHLQSTRLDRIGPDYFATIGVPLLHGREFTRQDRASSNTVIVNEQMARQSWLDQEPVGQSVEIDGKPHRVIGVVKNIRSGTILTRTFSSAFVPMTDSDSVKPLPEGLILLVRGEPGFDVVKVVLQEIHSRNPDLTVFNSSSMETDIANSLSFARMATFTYGAIGLYGLLLAAIGLAGVTAQAVARRTREIGIRIALEQPRRMSFNSS